MSGRRTRLRHEPSPGGAWRPWARLACQPVDEQRRALGLHLDRVGIKRKRCAVLSHLQLSVSRARPIALAGGLLNRLTDPGKWD